jgi:hypothetical protein
MNQRIGGLTLLVIMLASASPAQAQWVWVNERGIKQLSDQPPPVTVPPSRILKAPPGQMPDLRKELNTPAPEASAADAPSATAPEAKVKARPTLAERNADYNKRRIEAAESEQKIAQDAKQASAKADSCLKSRNNLTALESGQRIADYDAKGERIVIDDAQRARRIKDTQAMVAQNCN